MKITSLHFVGYQSQSILKCRNIRLGLGNRRANGQYSKCLHCATHMKMCHTGFLGSWATVERADTFHAQRKKRPSYDA